jgi:hypothetical protein
VQEFNFAPLVWEYLVSGVVKIENVYEIDHNFRLLITSLREAQNRRMDSETFAASFNMRFVVMDSTGKEVQLSQRGRTEKVTPANVGEYIALATEFRINELKPYLAAMRNGLWGNFGFDRPGWVDWRLLEYMACGEKDVDVARMKAVTEFDSRGRQMELFWRIVEELTSEERCLLIKFATARSRLPPETAANRGHTFFRVDQMGGTDLLPTSSTCFHQLHMPTYSSFPIALRCFRAAITMSGTFEMG